MAPVAGTITLTDYLCERLKQLEVEFVQGLPGDFTLAMLTRWREQGLGWIGNSNELNAGYSADGLARVLSDGHPRPAVLTTTFGVGELSACNALGGSMAERLPVVHIVGTPSTKAQDEGLLLHHTLGDHKFDAFLNMARQITGAQLDLYQMYREGRLPLIAKGTKAEDIITGLDACRAIDSILEFCVSRSVPVYIGYPSNMVDLPLPVAAAKRLQEVKLQTTVTPNNEEIERNVLEEILKRVKAANQPIILVDACASRHNVVAETRELVETTGLPVFSTPMGKTVIDELNNAQFGGVYLGSLSKPTVKDIVESADLILSVGALLSDYNTGSFSYRTKRTSTIELHSDHTKIGYAVFDDIKMKWLLPKITAALKGEHEKRLSSTKALLEPVRSLTLNTLPSVDEQIAELDELTLSRLGGVDGFKKSDVISQGYFWPRMGRFFQEGDCVLGETGTSSFGLIDVTFPKNAKLIAQMLWGSIGFTGGAVLGAALGMRQLQQHDPSRPGRTVHFIGDGSLQLTAQELGTVFRHGLTPLIFILNNDGYEIERQIFGPDEFYNDIAIWNHSKLIDFLTPPPEWRKPSVPSHEADPVPAKTQYHAIHTKAQLEKLLTDPDFNKADKAHVVEVFLPRGDSPPALKRQAALSAANNAA